MKYQSTKRAAVWEVCGVVERNVCTAREKGFGGEEDRVQKIWRESWRIKGLMKPSPPYFVGRAAVARERPRCAGVELRRGICMPRSKRAIASRAETVDGDGGDTRSMWVNFVA